MKTQRFAATLALTVFLFAAFSGRSQAAGGNSQGWTYHLLEGSYLIDDCTLCGRPTIMIPMRGSFRLVLTNQNPVYSQYQIQDVAFTFDTNVVSGSGAFQIGGEVAIFKEMMLDVTINSQPLNFTNEDKLALRRFPLIQVSLIQTQASFNFYRMELIAAPFQEIWFSTASSFTSANGPSGTPGDLLSATGRIVARNQNLLANLGFMPLIAPMGIDSVDIGPGGEIFFSLNESAFSETLGQIQHGDLLSSKGEIVSSNQALLAAFQPSPADIDYGLDAAIVQPSGEILFSVRSNVYSSALKTTLGRGDILSNGGGIFRRNADLLARFHPTVNADAGLDALYIWPNREIWFSTEQDFDSLDFGPIKAGDLLSDQGLIVYRNLELLSAFAPQEDLLDFGLDALYIVTDVAPPAPAPSFTRISADSNALALEWTGLGHVFQLERTESLTTPFHSVSLIQTDLSFEDRTLSPASFYRLRQW